MKNCLKMTPISYDICSNVTTLRYRLSMTPFLGALTVAVRRRPTLKGAADTESHFLPSSRTRLLHNHELDIYVITLFNALFSTFYFTREHKE